MRKSYFNCWHRKHCGLIISFLFHPSFCVIVTSVNPLCPPYLRWNFAWFSWNCICILWYLFILFRWGFWGQIIFWATFTCIDWKTIEHCTKFTSFISFQVVAWVLIWYYTLSFFLSYASFTCICAAVFSAGFNACPIGSIEGMEKVQAGKG